MQRLPHHAIIGYIKRSKTTVANVFKKNNTEWPVREFQVDEKERKYISTAFFMIWWVVLQDTNWSFNQINDITDVECI